MTCQEKIWSDSFVQTYTAPPEQIPKQIPNNITIFIFLLLSQCKCTVVLPNPKCILSQSLSDTNELLQLKNLLAGECLHIKTNLSRCLGLNQLRSLLPVNAGLRDSSIVLSDQSRVMSNVCGRMFLDKVTSRYSSG